MYKIGQISCVANWSGRASAAAGGGGGDPTHARLLCGSEVNIPQTSTRSPELLLSVTLGQWFLWSRWPGLNMKS